MAESDIGLGKVYKPSCSASFVLKNPCTIIVCTSASGNKWQKLPKLSAKLCNLSVVDREEEEGLRLFGNTDEDIALNILEQIVLDRLL